MSSATGMQLPDAAELIGVWEQGGARHPVDQALALLAAAYPGKTPAELAEIPLGRRDAYLLEFREALFGPALDCCAECPRCRTRLEFRITIKDLLGCGADENAAYGGELDCGDLHLRYRAPNSADLSVLLNCADVASARASLIASCVVEARRGGELLAVGEIPAPAIDELSAKLAESESCADTSFALQCADCGHQWQLVLDVVAFLWDEISSLAKRYLYEVHALAWAYGWSEADILAMTPARRRFYLERVS
jgi:hypothetical protein